MLHSFSDMDNRKVKSEQVDNPLDRMDGSSLLGRTARRVAGLGKAFVHRESGHGGEVESRSVPSLLDEDHPLSTRVLPMSPE